MEKRKRGRPPDGSKTRLDEPKITLRLNPEERADLDAIRRPDEGLSDAIRRAVRETRARQDRARRRAENKSGGRLGGY